jgi:hypothetical protein
LRRSISLSLSLSAMEEISLFGRSAFAHPFDDHLIDPFQRRMLRFGGRSAGIRLGLRLGRRGR